MLHYLQKLGILKLSVLLDGLRKKARCPDSAASSLIAIGWPWGKRRYLHHRLVSHRRDYSTYIVRQYDSGICLHCMSSFGCSLLILTVNQANSDLVAYVQIYLPWIAH